MTETNPTPPGSPNDPVTPGQPPATPPTGGAGTPTAPAPRRKRRRWIWVALLVIVLLIVGLVLLGPTLAGTGPVRSIVTSKINGQYLNGKMTIDDLSLGWTTGVKLRGVKLFDTNNNEVAEIQQVDTPITVLDAARGRFNLGDTTIRGVRFDAKLQKDGTLNVANLLKPQPKPEKPSRLPDLSGKIHLDDVSGKFEDEINNQTATLDSMTGEVDIPNINQPIAYNFDLATGLNGRPAGKTKLDGNVSAIRDNYVDTDHLAALANVELQQLALDVATPVLHAMKQDLDVGGVANGKLSVDMKSPDDLAVNGRLGVADFAAGGGVLKGDTLKYHAIDLPIAVSRKAGGGATALKVDTSIKADDDTIAVKVDGPQESLAAAPALFQTVLARLVGGRANATAGATTTVAVATTGPTGGGTADVAANVNVARLVSQLPHVVPLVQGTTLDSGNLVAHANVTLGNDSANVAAETHVKGVRGTRNGQPVNLSDIDATLGATALGGAKPDLTDLAVNVQSAFLTATGGGKTLGKTDLNGTLNLANLQQQLGQFVDLDQMFHAPSGSHVQLAGDGTFNVNTDGDLTAPEGDVNAKAGINLKNLVVSGLGKMRSVQQPQLALDLSGTLHHTADQLLHDVKNLVLNLDATPTARVQLAADLSMAGGKMTAPRFELAQCDVDLPKAAQNVAPFLATTTTTRPAGAPPTAMEMLADGTLKVNGGKLTAGVKGRYDGTAVALDQPLAVHVTDLELQQTATSGAVKTAREPAIDLVVSADPTAVGQARGIKNLTVNAGVGPETARILNLVFGADLNFEQTAAAAGAATTAPSTKITAPRFELTQFTADLAKLQADLGPALSMLSPPPAPGATPATQPSPSLVQSLADGTMAIASGTVVANAAGAYDGKTVTLSKPVTFALQNLRLDQHPADGTPTTVLQVAQAAGTANVVPAGNDMSVSADVKVDGISAEKYLSNESLHLTPKATLASDFSSVKDAALNLDSSFAKVDASNVQLALSGKGALDKLRTAHVQVQDANLAKLYALMNAFSPPPPPAQPVAVTAADVQAPPTAAAATAKPIPPLEVLGGTTNLLLDLGRDGDKTTLALSNFAISGLSLKRGNAAYQFKKNLTAQVNATLDAANDPTGQASLAGSIRRLTVTALDADLRVVKLSLGNGQSIVLDSPADPSKLDAKVALNITGEAGPTCRILEILSGAEPNAYPYAGHYALSEAINKDAGNPEAKVTGSGGITGFKVYGPAAADANGNPAPAGAPQQVAFAEDQVDINSNLRYNLSNTSVAFDKDNPLGIVMKSSGALALKVAGYAANLKAHRDLALTINLDYDLAKLWPVIKPMLGASLQDKLKDSSLTGKSNKTIYVNGALPADLPFNEGVKQLNATGGITVASASLMGLNLTSPLDLPFVLRGGKFRNVYDGQPEGKNHAGPVQCNGGTLDLGGFTIDMTQSPPVLTMETATAQHPQQVLQHVTVNPVFADSVLGKLINNPLFVNPNQASGLIDLALDQCTDVPMSDLVTKSVPQNKSLISGHLSLTNLVIGNQLTGYIFKAFGNNDETTTGNIQNASFTIQQGHVQQDTTLTFGKRQLPMRLAGGVAMDTKTFQNFSVGLPIKELYNDQNLARFLPDTFPVPLSGSVTAPQLQLQQVLPQLVQQAGQKALLNGLIPGANNAAAPNNAPAAPGNAPASTQPAQQDPLQQLLNDALGGKKKKDK